MNNYTSIQQGDHESSNGDADHAGDSSPEGANASTRMLMMSHKHKTLLGGFVTVVAGLAVLTSGGTDGSSSMITLESATSAAVVVAAVVRECTFVECYASSCDPVTAPFVCQKWNGGPMGGCSPTPWLEGTCDDSCSLANCDKQPIPPTTPTCEDVQCGEDTWCTSPQLCGEETPYQCTKGSARFGCSPLKLQWTLRSSDTTCSECCDITTCEGCRTSQHVLSYLASNGSSSAAVCVEKYYAEQDAMLANAQHLDQVNPTTLAVQRDTLCQDRHDVAYSRFLTQYVPPKVDTTYGNCWIKHFATEDS